MMTTRICFVAALLLALCCGRNAWSDDAPKPEPAPDPCQTDLTLEKLDNPPERKTKFEVAEEPWKERLVDVKVADQKFVAIIRIKLPKLRGAPFDERNILDQYGRTANLELSPQWHDFIRLQRFRDQDLMNPSRYVNSTREIDYQKLQLHQESSAVPALKRMFAQIPAERLPAKEDQEFFTNPDNDRLLLVPDPGARSARTRPLSRHERELLLLATTAEQAEGRARTLLSIIDQGYTRPIQMELFKVRRQQCESLRAAQEKHAAATKSWETLTGKLKEYEEFTPDMLSGLRVQQLQLEVDLAGVKAKILTCEKLLAKMGELERRKPIEDAKIAAEIELSGFEARRAKSAEFVAKLKERNQITENQARDGGRMQALYQNIQATTQAIQRIDEDIAAFAPVTLVDDRVTIHPLEWTQ